MRVPAFIARGFWSIYGRRAWDATAEQKRAAGVDQILRSIEMRGGRPGDTVLDAGCGTGEIAIACAQAGYRVLAVDFAPGMLTTLTRKLAERPGLLVTVEEADLSTHLPWASGQIDHVLAISVLQTLPQPPATLRELARVLRAGGSLTITHRTRSTSRTGTPDGYASRRPFWRLVKSVADRCGAEYWSVTTIVRMLDEAGFSGVEVDGDELLVVSAIRASA
jgi:ubiquinone/menaquinone biosynthesis C-methylase UbiE